MIVEIGALSMQEDGAEGVQAIVDGISDKGGGALKLAEAGYYLADKTINLRPNVCLIGTGLGTVLRLRDGVDAALVDANVAEDVTICDLTLDGNGRNQQGRGLAILRRGASAEGAHGLTVERVRFKDAKHAAIRLGGRYSAAERMTGVLLRRVEIDGSESNGIRIVASIEGVIEQCDIKNIAKSGLTTLYARMLRITGCWVRHCGAMGMEVRYSEPSGLIIDHCWAHDIRLRAINPGVSPGTLIDGVKIWRCGGGLELSNIQHQDVEHVGVQLSNVRVWDVESYGVLINCASDVTLSNVSVRDSRGVGVLVAVSGRSGDNKYTRRVILQAMQISRCQRGIVFQIQRGPLDNVVLSGSILADNGVAMTRTGPLPVRGLNVVGNQFVRNDVRLSRVEGGVFSGNYYDGCNLHLTNSSDVD